MIWEDIDVLEKWISGVEETFEEGRELFEKLDGLVEGVIGKLSEAAKKIKDERMRDEVVGSSVLYIVLEIVVRAMERGLISAEDGIAVFELAKLMLFTRFNRFAEVVSFITAMRQVQKEGMR